MKRWTNWTLLALALAVSVSAGYACGDDAKAEGTKAADPKDAKAVVAKSEKGCDMPCCARAKTSDTAKAVDAKAAPKKAAAPAVAKSAASTPAPAAEPAKDAPAAQPAADPGTRH
jgi:hypothetical protein